MARIAHWSRETVGVYLDRVEERALRAVGVGPAWEQSQCLEAALEKDVILVAPCKSNRRAAHLYLEDYDAPMDACLRTHLRVPGIAALPRFGPVEVEVDITAEMIIIELPSVAEMPWPGRYRNLGHWTASAQATRDLWLRVRAIGGLPKLAHHVEHLFPTVVLNCLRAGRIDLAERHIRELFPTCQLSDYAAEQLHATGFHNIHSDRFNTRGRFLENHEDGYWCVLRDVNNVADSGAASHMEKRPWPRHNKQLTNGLAEPSETLSRLE